MEGDDHSGRLGAGGGSSRDKKEEREAKKRRVPFGTHAEIKSLVHEVLSETKGKAHRKDRWIKYAAVGKEESERLKNATGMDFEGYVHLMDGSHIKHAFDRHGLGSKRLATDEIPLDPADFERVPQVIEAADHIRLLKVDKNHPNR
jgi:hypothetical protein